MISYSFGALNKLSPLLTRSNPPRNQYEKMKTRTAPFAAFDYPPGVTLTDPFECAYNPEIIWWKWPDGRCMWIGPEDEI